MPIDFGYAQARAQARHGERVPAGGWRLLESSDNLAQYLHAARGTALALRVEHFVANTSPHVIELSLRRDWRAAVDEAARWVPAQWRESVAWAALLPSLPAIAYLLDGGAVLPWMANDPLLQHFTMPDAEDRRRAITEAMAGLTARDSARLVDWWEARWQTLWPAPPSAHRGLHELIELLHAHRAALQEDARVSKEATDHAAALRDRLVRILRGRLREPVVIFCHLVLSALELQRLRAGLVRRALFNDVQPESAA